MRRFLSARARQSLIVTHTAILLFGALAYAADVPVAEESDRRIRLQGLLTSEKRHLNVSGLAFSPNRELLVIGSDEGALIQVLKQQQDDVDAYRAAPKRNIHLSESEEELDLEGVAWGEEHVFVIGSHSRKRERVKHEEPDPDDNKKAKQNRKRLRTMATEPSREQLFRLKLNNKGRAVDDSVKAVSLRNVFANDDALRPFQLLPSKENGIDIEGIAADGDRALYLGFRGPVLRGNFVPIMLVEFEDKFREKDIEYELLFVNLGGRGIRDIIRLGEDEFLILAGPIGDGPGSYRVFLWNGKDCVPGTDKPDALANAEPLCDLPERDGKAEGIGVLDRNDEEYELLIVYDGVEDGGATIYRCMRQSFEEQACHE